MRLKQIWAGTVKTREITLPLFKPCFAMISTPGVSDGRQPAHQKRWGRGAGLVRKRLLEEGAHSCRAVSTTSTRFPPRGPVLRGRWSGRKVGEVLTFQAIGAGDDSQDNCGPCFSATGSDPLNCTASAVLHQAGLLCHIYLLMSYLLPDAVKHAFRGQVSALPCPGLGVRTPRI